jgi:putative endonuclease
MYFVYILTNRWKTVLYTGMTDSVEGRVADHKDRRFEGFTKKYNCTQLVYFEVIEDADSALRREKQIIRMDACEEERADRHSQSGME